MPAISLIGGRFLNRRRNVFHAHLSPGVLQWKTFRRQFKNLPPINERADITLSMIKWIQEHQNCSKSLPYLEERAVQWYHRFSAFVGCPRMQHECMPCSNGCISEVRRVNQTFLDLLNDKLLAGCEKLCHSIRQKVSPEHWLFTMAVSFKNNLKDTKTFRRRRNVENRVVLILENMWKPNIEKQAPRRASLSLGSPWPEMTIILKIQLSHPVRMRK